MKYKPEDCWKLDEFLQWLKSGAECVARENVYRDFGGNYEDIWFCIKDGERYMVSEFKNQEVHAAGPVYTKPKLLPSQMITTPSSESI